MRNLWLLPMPRQFAITIGINDYRYYPRPLKYAENDAVAMEAYLREVRFAEVLRYSDHAPSLGHDSTYPERTNLLRAINRISSQIRLKPEDSFWFFFSGHGARQSGQDYLLPSDGDPDNLVDTAIPIDRVVRSLNQCGAGNLLLILDVCRNEVPELSKDIGNQTVELAKQSGIVTLFSCSPGERSYELPEQNQGAFTYVLLNALRGDCPPEHTNAQQLSQYLRLHVSGSARTWGRQTPYVVAEPIEKAVSPLLPSPQVITPQPPKPNFEQLMVNAYQAFVNQDFEKVKEVSLIIIRDSPDVEQRTQAADLLSRIAGIQMSQGVVAEAIAPPPPNEPTSTQLPIAETLSVGDVAAEAIAQTTTEKPTVRGEDPLAEPWEDVAKNINQASEADKTDVYVNFVSKYPDTQVSHYGIEEVILRAIYHQSKGQVLSVKAVAQQVKLDKSEVDQYLARFISQGYFQILGSILDGDTFLKVLPEGRKMLADRFAQVLLELQDDLSSEKGIDYTKLRDLLKAQDWKAADYETYLRMLEVVGRKKGDWIRSEELLSFPCTDLKTIDGLWVKHSKGRFGFSVQKKIYLECGGKLDGKYPGDKIWETFGDRVGWRQDGKLLFYENLNPDPLSSFQGVFPCFSLYPRHVLGGLLSLLSHRGL